MAGPQKSRRSTVHSAGHSAGPRVRRDAVRVGQDIAWRVRSGHPWLYREVLGSRPVRAVAGTQLDVLDNSGNFVARGLFDPDGPIAIRVFTRNPETQFNAPTIRSRVERAQKLRERLLPATLTAQRVVHSEGDGLPGVTVDRYGEFLVIHLYSACLLPFAPQLREALQAVWAPRAIYEQHRFRPQSGEGARSPAQLVVGKAAPVEVVVNENDLKFAIDVTAPLGTGLFLDLRAGRSAVARHAKGRRVLNLFSYTGAFSLYAARAGANEVVSVDLSARAHGRARRNLQINDLTEAGHEFIAGDAPKTLARFTERKRRFDLVVIDPPSFAQAKGQVFVAQKDYRDLVSSALDVVEPGGIVACASNTAKVALDDFDRMLGDGASKQRRTLSVIERCGLPQDFPVPAGFPEGHYLKFEICVAG